MKLFIYLKTGQVLKIPNVESAKITHTAYGEVTEYSINFEKGFKSNILYLNPLQIVAVLQEE